MKGLVLKATGNNFFFIKTAHEPSVVAVVSFPKINFPAGYRMH